MVLMLSTACPQSAQALAAVQTFVAVRTVLVLQVLLVLAVVRVGEATTVGISILQCLKYWAVYLVTSLQ
jgi:hypothetical protein